MRSAPCASLARRSPPMSARARATLAVGEVLCRSAASRTSAVADSTRTDAEPSGESVRISSSPATQGASAPPAALRPQRLPRRVAAAGAHHAAARVRPGAAEVEPLDRRPVARPAGDRPHEEDLVRRDLAVEDVPAGEPEALLQVPGREHLAVHDRVADVRRVLGDGVDHDVPELLALLLPVALPQVVRRGLEEYRAAVEALGAERAVVDARDRDVAVGPARVPAVLSLVPGALEVLERGSDVHHALVLEADLGAGDGLPVRELREHQVDLGRGALDAEIPDVAEELRLELALVHELQEGALRIGVREHERGVDLLAARERHAADASVAAEDPRDLRVGADLRPALARSRG